MIPVTDAATVLVAGTGNIFLGDDGFGPAVVQRLRTGSLPAHVAVRDYGVGGVHLAYDLLGGCEFLVLVDAVARGAAPGTVHLIEVEPGHVGSHGLPQMDAHAMDPATVFASLTALGGTLPPTVVVACEPACTDEGLGLSPAVAAAVPTAAAMIHGLVDGRRRTAG